MVHYKYRRGGGAVEGKAITITLPAFAAERKKMSEGRIEKLNHNQNKNQNKKEVPNATKF